jgi:hypothetical protein
MMELSSMLPVDEAIDDTHGLWKPAGESYAFAGQPRW